MSPRPPSGPQPTTHHAIDPDVFAELALLGGGERSTFVCRVISRFVEQSRQGLTTLESALTGRDTDTMRLVAHRMKGSARQVGATMLADACEDFLQAAERGELRLARRHLRHIEEAWTLALRELLARDLLLN
jgi:HPt (histidine-containing phosphotransfer) domain-containing protein